MFDSLDEQIRQDEKAGTSKRERLLIWLAIAVVSLVVFGGLYLGVRLLE